MDEEFEIKPCLCGKVPKIQVKDKPRCCYIKCCDYYIEVTPGGAADVYMDSAKQTLVKTWNQSMSKKAKVPD
jgi:hypothetical protein